MTTISDDRLTSELLAHLVPIQRKSMFVITSAFEKIGHRSDDARLWGSGADEPDPLVDRCIKTFRRLAAEGRIEAFGNLSRPRYSEVRQA